MAKITLGKTGLVKQDKGVLGWEDELNTCFQTLEDRTGLVHPGDPNGGKEGNWYGQTCWDSASSAMFECVRPGPATGASRSLWQRKTYVPPGTFQFFLAQTLPPGYLAFNGTYSKALYPNLALVLPSGVEQTPTTFTLTGEIFERGLIFFATGNSFEIGLIRDLIDVEILPPPDLGVFQTYGFLPGLKY